MGPYRIEWRNSVERDLKKIDKGNVIAIIKGTEKLCHNPFPVNCKKLQGMESFFRIRIRDYRVIYKVEINTKLITIFYVRHRKDAYKNIE